MKALINKIINIIKQQDKACIGSFSIDLSKMIDIFKVFNVKHKWAAPTVALFSVFVLMFSFLHHNAKSLNSFELNQAKKTSVILTKVDDIQANLQLLSSSPKNLATTISAINNDLLTIEKVTTELAKASDIQKVSNQITSLQQDVDTKMLDLKQKVSSSGEKQYIDSKSLPFRVISIDVISQQPFVSIDYVNHITPLAVGDSIAGWRIISANYDAAVVEFKNDHDQYVKVSLQG